MRVTVVGLWHLGSVTAACAASGGHEVVGLDFDEEVVRKLQAGTPPLFEPGLEELVRSGLMRKSLRFTTDAADAVDGAEMVWVVYDTPVDDADVADVNYVVDRVARLFPHLRSGALVLISSQLPVGSTRRLETAYAAFSPRGGVGFAYSPENLRLGGAIKAFTEPDRVVVGARQERDRHRLSELFAPFTSRIEWMSIESAEMTKHAVNAFLATSVAFINELATLCEEVGADAKEVERGLKSETRIGPKAYLSPGAAFAGGTLARDVSFLRNIGAERGLPTHLFSGVKESNDAHREWPRRTLLTQLGSLPGRTVAVLGLTYKPGTDTLRRSSSVELCRWLAQQGARVQAHDPAISLLPFDLRDSIALCASPMAALANADALVIATEWPGYAYLDAETVVAEMKSPLVVDPNRFLSGKLGDDPRVRYFAVGRARGRLERENTRETPRKARKQE